MSKSAPPVSTRHLAAVWFADIVGFTSLSARDERSAMALVSLLQTCSRRAVGNGAGRLVKFMGDAAMAEFGSTDAAVRAAVELKSDFQGLSAHRAIPALLRMGIHVGEVVSSDGDVYGDGVNTASRIQREAKPGEVLVSEDVWRQLKGRSEFLLEDRGDHELRGMEGKRRLYAVDLVQEAGLRVLHEDPVMPATWAIAVLPFVDISPDHDNEYFSDGITEELIHSLARVEGLHVASRTSSYSFKGRTAPIDEIAEALHVNVVLEGSVRKVGSRVRVTPLLVDAERGYQLWTDSFERELDDVFDLQEAISGAIVDALQVKLGAPERITREHTRDSTAYEEYLKGRYHWNRHSPEDFKQSIQHYERAIAADPEYALAWAGLADSYITMGAVFLGRPRDLYSRAREAARKALQLDPQLAAAQAALAEVQLRYDWDWEAAERGFRRALALDPDNADARYRYGNLLRDLARFDEAMVEVRRAQGMDPLSPPVSAAVAGVFYHARRYDEAIQECRRVLEQEPGFYNANFYLALCYLQKNMPEEAIRQFERVQELAGFRGAIAGLILGYAAAGRADEARTLLADLRAMAERGETSAYLMASACLALGENDEAFRWFDQAVEERTSWFTSLRVEPRFLHLHEDPRFQRLLAKVGFPIAAGRVPHNLPSQPTPIVGREEELKAVRGMLLDPAIRIVTLIGPGGVGKTRLAIEAASHSLEGFPDGVRFIPLSAVDLPDILVSALARALGIVEMGPDPTDALVTALRDRRMLLILDGFEHLLSGATIVADLLGALPELRVIVTSQATLRVRGERVFQVEPLAFPAPGSRESSPARLGKYGAVALFFDRMEAIKPTYVAGADDLDAIVEICRQLDGLPLAIELATARLRLMSPPALLGRLKDRFDFLVQGPRDLPERHQTLRAVCDWSYGLLDPREQAMFRNLTPFAGGCSLDAAEWMEGDQRDAPDLYESPTRRGTIELVSSLVEKSLVRQIETGEGEPRFQMLETIRQYGLRLLDSLGETEAIRRRQFEYFLDLALRAEPLLTGPDQGEWLDRLDRDHENIVAAMDWALETGDVERAVRLGSALWWFFWLRGHFAEMRTRLALALESGTELPRSLRANLLVASGAIATMDGQCELATRNYEQAVALEREREDRRGLPRALRNLASGLINLGRYDRALQLYEEALTMDREFGDSLGQCAALRGMAKTALFMEDLERAEELYREALSVSRSAGDRQHVAYALAGLGDVARQRQSLDEAESLYQEGLDLYRRIGSQPGLASALQDLATIAFSTGRVDRSEELHREALEISTRMNNLRGMAVSLAGLGACAIVRNAIVEGVHLLGAAERLQGSAGAVLPPHEQRWWRDRFESAIAAVGSETCERFRREGQSLSLEAVLDLVSEFCAPSPENGVPG